MKLVIVDIQPEYESNTTFDIGDMLRKAAEDYSQVLVLFNGEDTLGMISEGELKNFYLEKLDYDEDVFDELLSKSTFFDKGYGFFRDVMDSDVCFNRASIIKIVKYMIDKDIRDIRELEEEDIGAIGVDELLFDDLEDYGFWVPDLADELPKWSGSDLAGGARNECMAEVEILGAAQGLSFNHVDDFIYEGENRYTEIMSESKLLREYIRGLLSESRLVDFAIDMGKSKKYMHTSRDASSGREIKRIFNKHADHKFLSSLDTVHWSPDVESLEALVGRGRDELSATMTLPGGTFGMYPAGDFGLVISGRITLASNDMDEIYSGGYYDYIGSDDEQVAAKQQQRKRSSGINKLPQARQDYSRYAKLADKFAADPEKAHEFVKRKIQYVLDRETFDTTDSKTNEALVDNWKPVGIVSADRGISKLIEKQFGQDSSNLTGEIKRVVDLAQRLGLPIYDRNKNVIWMSMK